MAKNTKLDLRGQLMYSVFVRNHTPEGTFRALEGFDAYMNGEAE